MTRLLWEKMIGEIPQGVKRARKLSTFPQESEIVPRRTYSSSNGPNYLETESSTNGSFSVISYCNLKRASKKSAELITKLCAFFLGNQHMESFGLGFFKPNNGRINKARYVPASAIIIQTQPCRLKEAMPPK